MGTKVEIIIDEENNAEGFWEHVGASPDTPEELRAIEIGDRIEVSAARAEEIREWCEKAPGFSGGPEHARTALIFSEV